MNTILRLFNDEKENGTKIDLEFIVNMIELIKKWPTYSSLTAKNWEDIKFKIQTTINVQIEEGPIFLPNPDVERWLDHKRSEITWTYWKAYVDLLEDKGRTSDEIEETEKTIDEILDCSGDPQAKGIWNRRGLVMGNVQSGKTQNFLGLINKAIDCGYKIIVVLGGHQNDLREQTQGRLDEGVIGREATGRNGRERIIGVGSRRDGHSIPYYLTTKDYDFKKSNANTMGIHLQGSNEAIIVVVKKHATILKNLYEWIKEKNDLNVDADAEKKLDSQMLLIDDEADYASINTKHKKNDITAINSSIRKLLTLFKRSTYVGYTATPFANIFINPDEENELIGDDLFPKDFMIRTPIPDSYMGHKYYFQPRDNHNEDPIILVDDFEQFLPPKSKKDSVVGNTPESLKEAIQCFIINVATRAFRGQTQEHSTMLVHMTQYKLLHDQIAQAVLKYIKEVRGSSNMAFGYPLEEALEKSTVTVDFKSTFKKYYSIRETFDEIYPHLKWAINKTKVFAVHGDSQDKLDYDAYKENGLSVIAIGGHKLSRGLTLEGLSVSYFTRSSKSYDTLMQMCRWFGYRPGYEDLCKLFITPESREWYTFISEAIEELYKELDLMSKLKKSPSEFGLKVREHPGALQITAEQKINAAYKHTRYLDLAGRRIRKHSFYISDEKNAKNLSVTKYFIELLLSKGFRMLRTKDKSTVFYEVDHRYISEFILNTVFPDAHISDSLLVQYISNLEEENLPKFSVCVKNIQSRSKIWWSQKKPTDPKNTLPGTFLINPSLPEIIPAKRKMNRNADNPSIMSWSRQEIGTKHDERYFLCDPDEIEFKNFKNPFEYIRSQERIQPGIIIYPLSIGLLEPQNAKKDSEFDLIVPHKKPTISYSISFPIHENLKDLSQEEINRIQKEARASYLVNKVLKEPYIDYEVEYDDDEEDEYQDE